MADPLNGYRVLSHEDTTAAQEWAERQREQRSDEYEAEQAKDTAKFLAGVTALRKVLSEIEWPVGCPLVGWDIESMDDFLSDWLAFEAPEVIKQRAWDRAERDFEI
jgi:hypothetical protein